MSLFQEKFSLPRFSIHTQHVSVFLSGDGEHHVSISSRAQAAGPLPGDHLVLHGVQVLKML